MKTDKPINQLVREFLSEQDVNENSRYQYKINLNQFIHFCVTSKLNPRALRRADIISYKSKLLKLNRSPSTIDCYLTTVRKFFAWLELNSIYDNIAAGVHSPKRYRGHRKNYLKVDQVKKLLASIDRTNVVGMRNYAVVNLMLRAGVRRCEVCRMKVDDVYLKENRNVMRLQRKGHLEKDQVLGITEKIMQPIHDYLLERKDLQSNQPLFMNHGPNGRGLGITPDALSRMVRAVLHACGIDDKRITGHSLRHTAAITSLRAGATIEQVQEMLGHTSIETTKIYISAIEDETRLNNPAVQALDSAF